MTLSFFSFIGRLRAAKSKHQRGGRTPDRKVRPRLEALEDRTLLSTATTPDLAGRDRGLFSPTTALVSPAANRAGKQARRKQVLQSVTALDNQTLLLQFTKNLGKSADRAASYVIPGLTVLSATRVRGSRTVILTTTSQAEASYTVWFGGLRMADGKPVNYGGSTATFQGIGLPRPVPVPPPTPVDATAPRVVGAASTGNTKLLVSFSEPVADSALNPAHYSIVQESQASLLRVLDIRFVNGDRSVVELTTGSQNELTYSLAAVNIKDLAGNVVAPSQARFAGTPPIGAEIVDSDADGVPDHVEQRGWAVSVKLLDGTVIQRNVSSDPFNPDTDSDGLNDAQELALSLDPRNPDTDADLLADALEVNVLRSNAVNQDTDADGFTDGAEFMVLHTPVVSVRPDDTLPRLVGALSLGNNKVLISYSEAMSVDAIDKTRYSIFQKNVNSEAGRLSIVSAAFRGNDHRTVELTTASQDGVTYTVVVVGTTDETGNAIAPPLVTEGVLVNSNQADFAGTPPSLAELTDSDGDGLWDHEEQRGWVARFWQLDGTVIERQVTSDPFNPDTDGDGLGDLDEALFSLDPRDRDTDDDRLSDAQEFNEIYSDPARRDSDDDGIDDGLEFTFFLTSPVHKDTDGDQIDDGEETVLANRNPRIADVPLPAIKIGSVDLRLDVRFTVTDQTGTSVLDSKTVNTTLTQTESEKYSTTDGNTQEFSARIGTEVGFNAGGGPGEAFPKVSAKFTAEAGYTGQWTSSFTRESSDETQRQVSQTFQTDKTVTSEQTLQRSIEGARIAAEVNVQSLGDIAFTITNLQLTAFMQDPKNPARLIPVATLVPEAPAGASSPSFNLGPLVPERGPFVFVNDQVFPSLVQELMLNPQGLVFKISNYDITDERGRNFAFTSQDINDRTAPLVIDYGGGLPEDAEGLYTERYRVATSAGRVIEDTNGDGQIDGNDRRMPFDANGKATGILLRDALEGILGLTHYDEDQTPTDSLSGLELESSYSTKRVNGKETLWRIRDVSKELGNSLKHWVVLTPTGIDTSVSFADIVLQPGKGITLSFVQDLDNDRVPATWEAIHGTSDDNDDSDGDGLGDGFEFYGSEPDPADPTRRIQWTVEMVGKVPRLVTSSGARTDSDADGISDFDEYNRFVGGVRRSLDPRNPDTDGDGISDRDEIDGYTIQLRLGNGNTTPVTRQTDPLNPDSDGDGLKDGDERTLGLDPLVNDLDKVRDDDGDGLTNFEEGLGRVIKFTDRNGNEAVRWVWSDRSKSDSDGDGLTDRQEFEKGTNPGGKQGFDLNGDGTLDITIVHDLRNQKAILRRVVAGSEEVANNFDLTQFNNRIFFDGNAYVFSTTLVGKIDIDLGNNGSIDLRTEPQDTDLDRLPDLEELNGVTLNGGTVVFTNPLKTDTDGDGRSDGDEVKDSWVVNVSGQAPREVFSHPMKADEDADGLNDGQEFARGTHPQDANTDGDGVNDGREIELGTDPLVEDQKVVFTILSATAVKVPEGLLNEPGFSWLYGTGEWAGAIYVQKGSNARQELFALSALDNTRQGNTLTWGQGAREFVIRPGEIIRVYSEGTFEKDAADATELTAGSYDLDEFEEKFNETASLFPLSSTTKTLTLKKNSDTGEEGKLTFILEIKVLT